MYFLIFFKKVYKQFKKKKKTWKLVKVLELLEKNVDVNVYEERTKMTALMCASRQVSFFFFFFFFYK